MKYDKIILDTDICIKIGNYEKVKFLEMIIPKLHKKLICNCDIGRKTAKALWRSCGKNISEFDEVIWKV